MAENLSEWRLFVEWLLLVGSMFVIASPMWLPFVFVGIVVAKCRYSLAMLFWFITLESASIAASIAVIRSLPTVE
jgi:hypothetical protein